MQRHRSVAVAFPSVIALCGIALWADGSRAQDSSSVVTVQARITANDVPVNAPLNLIFELHSQPTGGTALWTEPHPNVQIRGGLLCVELGSQTGGFPVDQLAQGEDRYVAIRVNGGGEIVTPRIRLTAVPYALQAANASSGGVATINGSAPTNGNYGLAAQGDGLSLFNNGSYSSIALNTTQVVTQVTAGSGLLATGSTGALTLQVNPASVVLGVQEGSGVQINPTGPGVFEIALDPSAVVSGLNGKQGAVELVGGQGISVNAPPGQDILLAIDASEVVTALNGRTGATTIGAGSGVTVTNTASGVEVGLDPSGVVTSVNGEAGSVSIQAGANVTVTTAPSGAIEVAVPNLGAGGITSINGSAPANGNFGLTAGGRISVIDGVGQSTIALNTTQVVTGLTAGSGVQVSGATGDVTVSVDPAAFTTVNGQGGAVTLQPGPSGNVTITSPAAGVVQIEAAGGGGGGVQTVNGITPDGSGNFGVSGGFGTSVSSSSNGITVSTNTSTLDSRYVNNNQSTVDVGSLLRVGGGQTQITGSQVSTPALGTQNITTNNLTASNVQTPAVRSSGQLDLIPGGGSTVFVSGRLDANVVSANIKNFVVPYPGKPNLEIVYCSLEGPECALYARGSAKLTKGRATITLPDHFRVLAIKGTVTVQVTPTADCKGLFVARKSPRRIVVRELGGGKSDATFDYMVYAKRSGTEGHQVVRPRTQK